MSAGSRACAGATVALLMAQNAPADVFVDWSGLGRGCSKKGQGREAYGYHVISY